MTKDTPIVDHKTPGTLTTPKAADNGTPNIVDDADQQFVSIYVPNTKDASNPHYHYLRLGVADKTIEDGLPSDPNTPTGASNGKTNTDVPPGIVLYTTDSYTLTAPSVNTWSSDSLSAVTDGKDTLYTASYTTGAANGMRPATVTFQNVDQMANTAAASVNFLNGDALTYWNGNDQSLGLGGLLWANYGLTTNLFGGWILNLTNTSAELQGFGSYKLEKTSSLAAAKSISLTVSPFAGAYSDNVRMITVLAGIMAGLTGVTTLMNAAMTIELKTAAHDEASLKKAMQTLYIEQITATGLVALVQAMSILVAIKLKLLQAAAGASVASLTMDNTGITLQYGPPLVGPQILMDNTGIRLTSTPCSIAITPANVTITNAAGVATTF